MVKVSFIGLSCAAVVYFIECFMLQSRKFVNAVPLISEISYQCKYCFVVHLDHLPPSHLSQDSQFTGDILNAIFAQSTLHKRLSYLSFFQAQAILIRALVMIFSTDFFSYPTPPTDFPIFLTSPYLSVFFGSIV